MDLIKHTAQWASGDALQGKIMLGLSLMLLIAWILIVKSDHSILRGMLIPVALIVLIAGSYGGFLAFSRPSHVHKAEKLYQTDPQAAIDQEIIKAERDHKAYSVITKVWPALIVILGLLLFFVSNDYYRGLLFGFIGFCLFGLLLDTFLHHRLEPYRAVLKQLQV